MPTAMVFPFHLFILTCIGISSTIEALAPLQPYARAKTVMELLLRANKIFQNLEFSTSWPDIKVKWPEATEVRREINFQKLTFTPMSNALVLLHYVYFKGKVTRSGDALLSKARFSWYNYEHSLISALQVSALSSKLGTKFCNCVYTYFDMNLSRLGSTFCHCDITWFCTSMATNWRCFA